LRTKHVLKPLLAGPVGCVITHAPPNAALLAFYILCGTGVADFFDDEIRTSNSVLDSKANNWPWNRSCAREANVPQWLRLKILIHGQERIRCGHMDLTQLFRVKCKEAAGTQLDNPSHAWFELVRRRSHICGVHAARRQSDRQGRSGVFFGMEHRMACGARAQRRLSKGYAA